MAEGEIGHWAFIIGILLAVITALVPSLRVGGTADIVMWTLVILGLLIGFLNITERETTAFLVATIALLAVSQTSATIKLGEIITALLKNIGTFVFPATLIVAVKSIYELAKD